MHFQWDKAITKGYQNGNFDNDNLLLMQIIFPLTTKKSNVISLVASARLYSTESELRGFVKNGEIFIEAESLFFLLFFPPEKM